jgi:hypothetical protein
MNEETENTKLKDGLYIAKDGELTKLETDSKDFPKVKITYEVFDEVKSLQKDLRQNFEGYKPDILVVVSALLKQGMKQAHEEIVEGVRTYGQKLYS